MAVSPSVRAFFLCSLGFSVLVSVAAQEGASPLETPAVAPSEAPAPGESAPPGSVPFPKKQGLAPRLAWATSEMVGSNAVVMSWNYFILRAPFAQVSPEIWAEHFRKAPGWDNSDFFTNQILHPYQGNMYFNSARTNGFNFWQSAPFSAAGSFMWEYFGERDYASANDLITTTMGGIAMGEASYRMSAALLTDKPAGYRGLAREMVSVVLNPVQTINRLAFGRPVFDPGMGRPPAWSLDLISGLSMSAQRGTTIDNTAYPFLGAHLDYGDPYSSEDWRLPYDYFTVDCGVTLQPDNAMADVFGHAVLVGREVHYRNDIEGAFGLFQHFDYLENKVYKFAANGVGLGVQAMAPFGEKGSLQFWLHLAGIALGGVNSAYSKQIDSRDYCLGPGTAFKASLIFNGDGPYRASLVYNRYQFYTVSGADNHNMVGIFMFSGEVDLSERLSLGGGWSIYDRQSDAEVDNAYTTGVRLYLNHAL